MTCEQLNAELYNLRGALREWRLVLGDKVSGTEYFRMMSRHDAVAQMADSDLHIAGKVSK